MSDQCANCDVRGHFDKCEGVECGHHENWYPNELKKQLAAAEQRAETLKDERDMYDARATEYWEDVLELSDKLEDAEQRAEKAEKRVDVLAYSPDGKGKLVEKFTEIVAARLDVFDQRKDGIWPPETDTGRWIRRYRGTPKENLPQFAIEINLFKIEVDEFVAMLILAIKQSYSADLESWCQNRVSAAEQRAEQAEKRVDDLFCSTSGMEKLLAEIAKRAGVEDGDVDGLIEWAEKAEQAEKDLAATMVEVAEILHNRQAKIEALKTAERNAVRECERIASRHIANAQHVAYQIRNRYPQHFEEE